MCLCDAQLYILVIFVKIFLLQFYFAYFIIIIIIKEIFIKRFHSYIFTIFLCATCFDASVKPSHSAILTTREESVGIIWYCHNLLKRKKVRLLMPPEITLN